MQRWLVLALVAAGCGDNLPPRNQFEVVGHATLGARGMNSALAVDGNLVYVGSRVDQRGIAIVDVSDPTFPLPLGELGPPDEGLPAMSSRELRVVPERDLLIVENVSCTPGLHGCAAAGGEFQNLKFYDLGDPLRPALIGRYDIIGTMRDPRAPHEFYLRRDGARLLLFVSTPPGPPGLEVIDITDPTTPTRVTSWDPQDEGLIARTADSILHSVSLSEDGRTAFLSYQQAGLLVADVSALPAIHLATPPDRALTWGPAESMGPHSAVAIPGRAVVAVTEEVYPAPFGTGCPYGHLRLVDVADPTALRVLGEVTLPENDPATCATAAERTTFTAHNVTATHDLVLASWYAGGLQAIDVSDPSAPKRLAEFRPEPLPSVLTEDPALGGNPVAMWSYPVVQDGLIYVVDIRNGLYILRYTGVWEEELADLDFAEGNSNL